MRFAGCCNISCKRIDAVEHSDDLGASRKGRNLPTSEKQSTLEKIASPLRRGSKKLQQSNAPGPKDLDALACRLAERVRPRLAKTDGGQTYVSQSVPHPELMEALQDEGLDESSAEGALVAMRDVEIMRRVATGPRAKDDLYRFNDAVLPATMRIILSTVRFPDVAGDPEGVRVTFPVPDGGRRSSLGAATTMATDMIAVTGATKSSQAPSTVYLRVCDRVADKKELAKQWAEALAAGAEKQQPLGGYRGEDVAAKNPFTKALAARGRLAVAS